MHKRTDRYYNYLAGMFNLRFTVLFHYKEKPDFRIFFHFITTETIKPNETKDGFL